MKRIRRFNTEAEMPMIEKVLIGNKVNKKVRLIQKLTLPNNEIWYTSNDGNPISNFNTASNFGEGLTLVSNTYEYGKGIAKYSGDVTTIGAEAFDSCSELITIRIPDSVTSIGEGAFAECRGLTSINIPDSVTSIGDVTFSMCKGLTSIEIPNSITNIGGYVFQGCSGLISIEIPDSVTSIGGAAFAGCSGLTSINIPDSVTSIGTYAFSSCTGLTSITCNAETAPTIQYNTFQNVKENGTLYYPYGSNYSQWLSTGDYYLGKYGWNGEELLPEMVSVKDIQVLTSPIYADTTKINASYTLVDVEGVEYSRTKSNIVIPTNETGSEVSRTVSVTDMGYTFDVNYTQSGCVEIVSVKDIQVLTSPIYANTTKISVSYTLVSGNGVEYARTNNDIIIPTNETGVEVSRTVSVTDMGYTFNVPYTQSGEEAQDLPGTPKVNLDIRTNVEAGRTSGTLYDSSANQYAYTFKSGTLNTSEYYINNPRLYTLAATNLPVQGSGDWTMFFTIDVSTSDLTGNSCLYSGYGTDESYNNGRWYIHSSANNSSFSAIGNWSIALTGDGDSYTCHTFPNATSTTGKQIVTMTRSGNTITIYINGTMISSVTVTKPINTNGTFRSEIGCYGCSYQTREYNSDAFKGNLYSVVMYDSALTQTEISNAVSYLKNRFNF